MTRSLGLRAAPDRRRRTRWAALALAGTLAAGAALVVQDLGGAFPTDPAPPPSAMSATTPTGLDPELERRFGDAQGAAAADGVTLTLTSGWRSAAQQQALVDDAIERHGSLEEARRWVLPPESSAHVQGTAIDVGPTEGALWLGEREVEFGLCRTYANELWHFEPLADGADRCPDQLLDSSGGW
ncbi:M15 family metallopeptidase [Cellulomonas fengjieae]|uniref:M15 family metallopeptidase n=1 Tax=Cellulomonas fengjieae TaxID=2819978 RepID=UPI001AAE9F3F|nr:M15 family metallopeptidase [Cellulomonas fengjieae]MBO3100899.1 M15 family metallopeptidase [Cellulomonas fengjieae]